MQTALPERNGFLDTSSAVIGTRHRDHSFGSKPLGRIGTLEVRLACDAAEIAAAQEIRYRIFYEELGAGRGSLKTAKRDADRFDDICDHLLVFDTALTGPAHHQIVGTYRLLRQERALVSGGFYSDEEFELKALITRHPGRRFLELGRSCVLPAYRSKRTIEVLWQGIWAYVNHYDIGVMAGCASFQGTVPAAHAEALSYLAHHCRTSSLWDVRAVAGRYSSMDLMPAEAVSPKSAILAMPPLIKAYLRIGARVGDGCVIDADFGTVDVFVVLPVNDIGARYINYYGGESQSFAA
ncbi:GNAT family N-acetyltransferase [Pseudaminobacter arsenicus]|uniref:L-ornithine N(alpha)-acyltransferase n=1 Tax=Borborobacter arsenicus TaxID=1851146 RepID=A0A432V2W0_9HYPH|nr:GNAT family N-acetyltransferase [Pseudaminobacter arsenicus]RUM96521.1 GNAT family N-acetyltransferase [Pseudaminobacter arsenicus]